MEPWMVAIVLKPVILPLFMAGIVIPIELALRTIWPEGPVKGILFARNFDKRHPRLWLALGIASYVVMGLIVWAYLELIRT